MAFAFPQGVKHTLAPRVASVWAATGYVDTTLQPELADFSQSIGLRYPNVESLRFAL